MKDLLLNKNENKNLLFKGFNYEIERLYKIIDNEIFNNNDLLNNDNEFDNNNNINILFTDKFFILNLK